MDRDFKGEKIVVIVGASGIGFKAAERGSDLIVGHPGGKQEQLAKNCSDATLLVNSAGLRRAGQRVAHVSSLPFAADTGQRPVIALTEAHSCCSRPPRRGARRKPTSQSTE
jgi:hypothetical protein